MNKILFFGRGIERLEKVKYFFLRMRITRGSALIRRHEENKRCNLVKIQVLEMTQKVSFSKCIF